MTSVSAIIVAVPSHLIFLQALIKEIRFACTEISEIIVIASGCQRIDVDRAVGSSLAKVVMAPLQSAGANRNIGLDLSVSELVFFHDADDHYSAHRIGTAISLYETHEFDLLLHGFMPFSHGDSPPPFPEPPEDIGAIKVVRESSLAEATLHRNPRNRDLELKGETETTNLLFNNPSEAFEVHHAHAIVRREAVGDIRYHEEFGIRNEDGVFARDMLEAGKKILLTPFVLSAYRHGARAKPTKPSKLFRRK